MIKPNKFNYDAIISTKEDEYDPSVQVNLCVLDRSKSKVKEIEEAYDSFLKKLDEIINS